MAAGSVHEQCIYTKIVEKPWQNSVGAHCADCRVRTPQDRGARARTPVDLARKTIYLNPVFIFYFYTRC